MRIICRRCHICQQMHNHITCPYCGAMKIGAKHYDILTGRELVRAHGLPRILQSQITPMLTRAELIERIVPRLIQRSM